MRRIPDYAGGEGGIGVKKPSTADSRQSGHPRLDKSSDPSHRTGDIAVGNQVSLIPHSETVSLLY